MDILKQEGGLYKVESGSRKGKFYIVDFGKGTCTCPHFALRLKRVHGICKHMQAVKDKTEARDSESYKEIVEFVKEKGEVESLELINRFNEEAVDDLLCRGELIEKNGFIKLLD